jgi:hypothetical protein
VALPDIRLSSFASSAELLPNLRLRLGPYRFCRIELRGISGELFHTESGVLIEEVHVRFCEGWALKRVEDCGLL